MRIIDLSHPIFQNMPVYPETAPPSIDSIANIDAHGFEERKIVLTTHTAGGWIANQGHCDHWLKAWYKGMIFLPIDTAELSNFAKAATMP